MCVHIFSMRDPEQKIGALYVASESVLLLRPIVENAEYWMLNAISTQAEIDWLHYSCVKKSAAEGIALTTMLIFLFR